MKVLVIDVGGTNVKILASGQKERLRFPSGRDLTPDKMVAEVKKLAANWQYDAVSIGVPGPFLLGQLISDPQNLGPGWVDYDFSAAFGAPVKIVNDAAMQALGSYKGGKMLFIGLGTGLGTAMVINGVAESRELARLPYKKKTYEHYVGVKAMRRLGKKAWRKNVEKIVGNFVAKIHADDVVLGGGNAKKLKKLPKGCRAGANANAFIGGFRLWQETSDVKSPTPRPLELLMRRQQMRGEITPATPSRAKRRA
jgi:polyphosphate glucokinase